MSNGRIGPKAEKFLFAVNPIYQPPQLPSSRADKQEKTVSTGQFFRLVARPRVFSVDISEFHAVCWYPVGIFILGRGKSDCSSNIATEAPTNSLDAEGLSGWIRTNEKDRYPQITPKSSGCQCTLMDLPGLKA